MLTLLLGYDAQSAGSGVEPAGTRNSSSRFGGENVQLLPVEEEGARRRMEMVSRLRVPWILLNKVSFWVPADAAIP